MQGLNVIIAEDHKLFRELLVSVFLENKIQTIGEARNGIQLLNLLKVNRPDLVLLDIEMPDMDGASALKRIMHLYPDQKVIILTQHENELLSNYFISIGAKAFMTKNSDTSFLIETMHKVHLGIVNQPSQVHLTIFSEKIKFSQRESEIIPLICEGKSNKEIADKLNVGNKTVEAHKKNLFIKTKTTNVVEFVVYLFRNGLNNLH